MRGNQQRKEHPKDEFFLGKVRTISVCGPDYENLYLRAKQIAMDGGFTYWGGIYKKFDWWKLRWEYRIDLHQPLNFYINRVKKDYKEKLIKSK